MGFGHCVIHVSILKRISFPYVSDLRHILCSLSQLVRWMAMKAEEVGVEIYPGFAASEVIYLVA